MSHAALPDLGCLLLSLDDGGCRGSVLFQYVPADVAARWKEILRPGSPVRIKIEHIPRRGTLMNDGIVAEVREEPMGTEIALLFREAVQPPAPAPPRAIPNAAPVPVLRYKPLGEILVHMRRLKPQQIESAVKASKAGGEKLGHYLIRSGAIGGDVLCRALALQSGLPMTELEAGDLSEELGQIFGLEVMSRYGFVPIDQSESFLCIAVGSPLKPAVILELEQLCRQRIEVFLCDEKVIANMLDHFHARQQESHRSIQCAVRLPVRYQFCNRVGVPAEEPVYEGTTVNLSESKIHLEGPPATLDSPDNLRRRGLCLNVMLQDGEKTIRVLCRIRAIRPQGAGPAERWFYSLNVVDANDLDRRRLKELRVRTIIGQRPK